MSKTKSFKGKVSKQSTRATIGPETTIGENIRVDGELMTPKEPEWSRDKTLNQLQNICRNIEIDPSGMSRGEMVEQCDLRNLSGMSRKALEELCLLDPSKTNEYVKNATEESLVKCIVDNEKLDWKKELKKFRRETGIIRARTAAEELKELGKELLPEQKSEFKKEAIRYLENHKEQSNSFDEKVKGLKLGESELPFVHAIVSSLRTQLDQEVREQLNLLQSTIQDVTNYKPKEPKRLLQIIKSALTKDGTAANEAYNYIMWLLTIKSFDAISFVLSTPFVAKILLTIAVQIQNAFCYRFVDWMGWLKPEDKKLWTGEKAMKDTIQSLDMLTAEILIVQCFDDTWIKISNIVKSGLKFMNGILPGVLNGTGSLLSMVPGIGWIGTAFSWMGSASTGFATGANNLMFDWADIIFNSIGFAIKEVARTCVYAKAFMDSFYLFMEFMDFRKCTRWYNQTSWYKPLEQERENVKSELMNNGGVSKGFRRDVYELGAEEATKKLKDKTSILTQEQQNEVNAKLKETIQKPKSWIQSIGEVGLRMRPWAWREYQQTQKFLEGEVQQS